MLKRNNRLAVSRTRCLASSCLMVLSILGCGSTASAQSSSSPYLTASRYLPGGDLLLGTISPPVAGQSTFVASRNSFDAILRLQKVESGYLASWQTDSVLPQNWSGFTVMKTVTYAYDANGRKIQETTLGSDGGTVSVTQYSYDVYDRLICTAVRMDPNQWGGQTNACVPQTNGSNGPDRITETTYDALNRQTLIQKAVGTSLQQNYAAYTYDLDGHATSMTDARGYMATMSYDGYGRQSYWFFPSPTATGQSNSNDYEAYGYDSNGNRTSLRKRDGSTLIYNYDALNRVASNVVPGRGDLPSTDTRSVYYGYDLQNHQLAARFDSLTGEGVTNAFDGLGRQTSSSLAMDGVTRTVSLQYDLDGNRTQMAYPDGNYVTYSYDGMDRPTAILRSGSASIAGYTYDAAGRRTGFNSGVSTGYGYDAASRLTSLANNPNNNGAYANTYGFGYNPASQINSLSKSSNSFVFNGAYNVSRGYSVNGLNQYTQAGAASFVYDANGNLTGDASTTFLYDVENRLVGAGGLKQAQLRYDPLGRLYEVAGPTGTTRFFYNGDELIGEYDTSGNLLRRYAHGVDLKSDDPIAWYEGAGFDGASERFLRPDWQGSIALVTDNSGSTVYAANTFDEYGIPGGNNAGRFQYTGQAWLSELGMYYYKARFYSPTLGRFMQTDPIGYKDQINLYAYVGNDPMDKTDFTGNQQETEPERDELRNEVEPIRPGSPELEREIREVNPGYRLEENSAQQATRLSQYDTFGRGNLNGNGTDDASQRQDPASLRIQSVMAGTTADKPIGNGVGFQATGTGGRSGAEQAASSIVGSPMTMGNRTIQSGPNTISVNIHNSSGQGGGGQFNGVPTLQITITTPVQNAAPVTTFVKIRYPGN